MDIEENHEEDIFICECNLSIVRRILAVSQSYCNLKYHSHTSYFSFVQMKIFHSNYRKIFSYQLIEGPSLWLCLIVNDCPGDVTGLDFSFI